MPSDLGAGLGEVQARAKHEVEERLQFGTIPGIETRTTQANDIESSETVEEHRTAIRRDVFAEAAIPLGNAVAANTKELMEHRTSADNAVVAHLHMPSEERCIGNDIVVSDLHIMREVHGGHDEVLVAHTCDRAGL